MSLSGPPAFPDTPVVPRDTKRSTADSQWSEIALHRQRGIQFGRDNQLAAALGEFDMALALCNTCAEIWLHRGVALEAMNQLDLAYDSIAQAVILTPIYPAARQRLMQLGQKIGRPPIILTQWEEDPKPRWTERLLRKKNTIPRPSELPPEPQLRKALMRNPRAEREAVLMGSLLAGCSRHAEAESFFRYALMLAPWSTHAAVYLARLAASHRFFGEAGEISASALRAGAADEGLSTMALWCGGTVCDWTDRERWMAACRARLVTNPTAMDPFAVLHFYDEPELQQTVAAGFAKHTANGAQPLNAAFRTSADRPITVGYISADYRLHPVAMLVAELFELHDRRRFRVHGYSVFNGEPSKIGTRIRRAFDKFSDISKMTSIEAAHVIKRDKVDILVDLTGFTQHPPFEILAHKPAPIQVNYLGYPGTLGAPVIDYIIVDRTVVPAGQALWFTEKLVNMPDCYQINDRKRAISKAKVSRADFGLPAESVVYCSFNTTRKISPEIFRIWMRILRRVPGSILWLLTPFEGADIHLHREAEKAGVTPDRIRFAPKIDPDEHLARYQVCDVLLDTLPYNAHTTASDALWGGCPVVTCIGKTFPARVAASILQAAGLADLIATSLQDYEELAVRIGSDPALRADLKQRVGAARESSALFDTPRFVRQLEWALEKMWDLRATGRGPETFDVPVLELAQ